MPEGGGGLGNGDDELKTEAGQRALLRLLHDLGALVAHGLAPDDRAVRRDVMLLDPNWLTGGVYAILTAPVLRQQNGVFHRSDLQNWLDLSRYPVERHEFILEMMQDKEVGLCFELPGERGERFLAPEALPPNTPDYDFFGGRTPCVSASPTTTCRRACCRASSSRRTGS